jgi:hypothetical protein
MLGAHRVPRQWQAGVIPGREAEAMGGAGSGAAMGGVLSSLMSFRRQESAMLRGGDMSLTGLSQRRSMLMELLDMLEAQAARGGAGGAGGMGGISRYGATGGAGGMSRYGAMRGAGGTSRYGFMGGMGSVGRYGAVGGAATAGVAGAGLAKTDTSEAKAKQNKAAGEKMAAGPLKDVVAMSLDAKSGLPAWRGYIGKLSGDRRTAVIDSVQSTILNYVKDGKFVGKVADERASDAVKDVIGLIAQDNQWSARLRTLSVKDAGETVVGLTGDALGKLGTRFQK